MFRPCCADAPTPPRCDPFAIRSRRPLWSDHRFPGIGGRVSQAVVEAPRTSRVAAFRASLDRADRLSLGGMAAFVLLLHVLGFGILFGLVAPQHLSLGTGKIFGVGVGLLAYSFGLRHAFDADHIAAV